MKTNISLCLAYGFVFCIISSSAIYSSLVIYFKYIRVEQSFSMKRLSSSLTFFILRLIRLSWKENYQLLFPISLIVLQLNLAHSFSSGKIHFVTWNNYLAFRMPCFATGERYDNQLIYF